MHRRMQTACSMQLLGMTADLYAQYDDDDDDAQVEPAACSDRTYSFERPHSPTLRPPQCTL
jgi:hypothetical protein